VRGIRWHDGALTVERSLQLSPAMAPETTMARPPKTPRADRIRSATGSTFDSLVLEGEGPIAVEFMSYGCEHCRLLEPVLQRVAEIIQPEQKVFRVNIAVEHELAETYAIGGTPTLVMFLNGREVGRTEGPRPTEANILALVTRPFES
jgi:thiol-disulfide isomerase/thioredoxin